MHSHHSPPTPMRGTSDLSLGHVLDRLAGLIDDLATLAARRDDRDLARLTTTVSDIAWDVHSVAEQLARVAGVPDEGGAA